MGPPVVQFSLDGPLWASTQLDQWCSSPSRARPSAGSQTARTRFDEQSFRDYFGNNLANTVAAFENARRAPTHQFLSQSACPAMLNGRRSLPPPANGDSKVCPAPPRQSSQYAGCWRGSLSYRLLSRRWRPLRRSTLSSGSVDLEWAPLTTFD